MKLWLRTDAILFVMQPWQADFHLIIMNLYQWTANLIAMNTNTLNKLSIIDFPISIFIKILHDFLNIPREQMIWDIRSL